MFYLRSKIVSVWRSSSNCIRLCRCFIALGIDTKTRLVLVVHVYRDENVIRIIPAREADPKEKQQFEQVNYGS